MIKKILLKLYSPILKEVRSLLTEIHKPEYMKQIERAYKAGYRYHQKVVNNDPELLKWITREHYFEEQKTDK